MFNQLNKFVRKVIARYWTFPIWALVFWRGSRCSRLTPKQCQNPIEDACRFPYADCHNYATMLHQVGVSQASSARLSVLNIRDAYDGVLLICMDTIANATCNIVLRGAWSSTRVSVNDVVRVIRTNIDGTFMEWDTLEQFTDLVVVDDERNLLIVHPDVLISGSSIADSVQCPRKTVLLVRNPGAGGALSSAALYGNLIHELFQTVLVILAEKPHLPVMDLFSLPEDILADKAGKLYELNVSTKDALAVLHDALPRIHDWFTKYYQPVACLRPRQKMRSSHVRADEVRIEHVRDIEELVWSPVTGLKGMIDATVDMTRPGKASSIGILELKTGSAKSVAHHAQVALYKLLLSDRYEATVTDGLVTYIPSGHRALNESKECGLGAYNRNNPSKKESPSDTFVNSHRGELVGLVMQRNLIAYYANPQTDVFELPPVLARAERMCRNCFVQETCLVQNKLMEDGSVEAMADEFDQELFKKQTSHLNDAHSKYFQFWLAILAAEEAVVIRPQKRLWTMTASEREAEGTCIANLKLIPNSNTSAMCSQNVSLSVDGKHVQWFAKHEFANDGSREQVRSKISAGDYVLLSVEKVISDESGRGVTSASTTTWKPALTNGFVHSVSEEQVGVLVERNMTAWARKQRFPLERLVWRVDSEEIFASYRTAKANLTRLFILHGKDDDKHSRLRKLIVDYEKPRFLSSSIPTTPIMNSCIQKLQSSGVELNNDQREALEFFERSLDYMLLLGMPGTGKSTTLAAITIFAASQGKSVLLCSHTHSAVDTVLLKLLDLGFENFVRIGRVSSVTDSRIEKFVVDPHGGKTVEELEDAYSKPSVVAATCLAINSPVFSRRSSFDIVVVDEASQILQPISLGPILLAEDKFVLVGDHHQLPPLLRARDPFAKGKLASLPEEKIAKQNVSLFRRLCDAHQTGVVSLKMQYRMAQDIMNLSSKLVYNDGLQCGNEQVAKQKLQTDRQLIDEDTEPWLKSLLDPENRVVFVDMDSKGKGRKLERVSKCEMKHETKDVDESRKNLEELRVISKAIRSLRAAGIEGGEITVLSPFRAQVEQFRIQFKDDPVQVYTIDQYQGRDNECVFVSLVRSGVDEDVGPLLRDWRRLNVAITRAKKKLVLVGSRQTLRTAGVFMCNLLDMFKSCTVTPS